MQLSAREPDQRQAAASLTEMVTMCDEQQIIRTEQHLSDADVEALRAHVAEYGLHDLPFGATVHTVKTGPR